MNSYGLHIARQSYLQRLRGWLFPLKDSSPSIALSRSIARVPNQNRTLTRRWKHFTYTDLMPGSMYTWGLRMRCEAALEMSVDVLQL
jgi:hypothetical protein